MLAAEHYPAASGAVPNANELLEIHHSKISLHHAKSGYDYPTIRLPHTFSNLAGLSTRVYQTVHDGALAFLVVISPAGKTSGSPKTSVFTRRRSPVRIRPSPSFFYQSATLKPPIEAFSLSRIMTRNKHNNKKVAQLRRKVAQLSRTRSDVAR